MVLPHNKGDQAIHPAREKDWICCGARFHNGDVSCGPGDRVRWSALGVNDGQYTTVVAGWHEPLPRASQHHLPPRPEQLPA